MDYIIAASLLVIAICTVFGKGFKITINHSYDIPQDVNPVNPVNQDKLDEEFQAMTNVVQTIQDFMGVSVDE